MGAFRYCRKCESPLGKPSPLEDLIEGQGCPNCDTCQPNIYTKEEWIIEAFDEIEKLKEELAKIRNSGFAKLDNKIKRLVRKNNKLENEVTTLKNRLDNK